VLDTRPPNVVFILSDDQGPWALGCAGNSEIQTPNLDRLAAAGTRFSRFFCTSPVCSPARASIVTGRIPSQHGVHDWLNDRTSPPMMPDCVEGLTTYTDVLAANGYVCGLSGKWHLGGHLRPQHGFTHWFCHPVGGGRYQDMEMIRDGRLEVCPGYLTDVITDDALGFLDSQDGSRPFYLSVHYTAPHSPWTGHPQDIVDSYDNCPFKSCPQEAMHPWAISLSRQCLGKREMLKGYFAAVTAMDANIGRILDKIEARGWRDDTLVVFMGDNGFSCGHHGFWGKGNGTSPLNMYDNSILVPAVFSLPGRIPMGRVADAMVSQYDVFPALLALLGLPPLADDSLPGRSFVPVLLGRTDDAREDVVVFDEYGPVRMIRTREWKYVHRYPNGPHELYDLVKDPDERRNLVDDKDRQPVVEDLRRRLVTWFARYVVPERDGTRFPVSGAGQLSRLDANTPGECAFCPIHR